MLFTTPHEEIRKCLSPQTASLFDVVLNYFPRGYINNCYGILWISTWVLFYPSISTHHYNMTVRSYYWRKYGFLWVNAGSKVWKKNTLIHSGTSVSASHIEEQPHDIPKYRFKWWVPESELNHELEMLAHVNIVTYHPPPRKVFYHGKGFPSRRSATGHRDVIRLHYVKSMWNLIDTIE